jgi:hypothetical protein
MSIAAVDFVATTNIARVISSARRGKSEINSGTNHLGFRCVKSPGDNRKG